jgi:outer membrane immunogenic protein
MGDAMRSSRLIVTAAAVAVGSTVGIGAASAADLPVRAYTKAPAIVAEPGYDWSGFYIGASAGGDWIGKDNAVLSLPPGPPQAFLPFLANGTIPTNYGTTGAGAVYGGQLGYNWQIQNVVLGLEADFFGSSLNRAQTQSTSGFGSSISTVYSTNLDWFGTVRGRLGAAVTPRFLAYVTGGFAYGDVGHSYSETSGRLPAPPTTNQSFGSVKNLDTGWVVGAGLEWAVTNNFTVRGEYLYTNLSSNSFTTPSNNPNCGVVNACSFTLSPSNLSLNIVRAGFNYKFGGPVVARY